MISKKELSPVYIVERAWNKSEAILTSLINSKPKILNNKNGKILVYKIDDSEYKVLLIDNKIIKFSYSRTFTSYLQRNLTHSKLNAELKFSGYKLISSKSAGSRMEYLKGDRKAILFFKLTEGKLLSLFIFNPDPKMVESKIPSSYLHLYQSLKQIEENLLGDENTNSLL